MLTVIFYILISIGVAGILWEMATGKLFPWQTNYKLPREKREAAQQAIAAEERWQKMTPKQRDEERRRIAGEELVGGYGCEPVPRKLFLSRDDPEYKRIFSPAFPFPSFPAPGTRNWTVHEEALMIQAQNLVLHASLPWSRRAHKICEVLRSLRESARSSSVTEAKQLQHGSWVLQLQPKLSTNKDAS
jgi:hypothetical protein